MTAAADRGADALESLFAEFGGEVVTYTQGSTAISVADAWKGMVVREGTEGLDRKVVTWKFRLADLSVTPSPGDTVTEGSTVWEVGDDPSGVRSIFFGAGWAVDTAIRVQRG